MTVQTPTAEALRLRAAIDRSSRYPVLFFITSAAAWLFVASLLGLASSVKLAAPSWMENCAIFGYGRLFPAHLTALLYGWAIQGGIGVMLWLMARLTKNEIRCATLILVAGHFWNALVALSVISIWFGFGRAVPFLDFPEWLWPMLAVTYALVTVWVIPMFRNRSSAPVYISEKFLLGAAVWLPWVFVTANIIMSKGTSPVMGAGVSAWFISNLIYFWMAPITLAIAYYIIPKITARPIYSYPLATLSFWILAILAGWTGFSRFMGGPFPAWMPAVSSAAAIFILLAVIATIVNLGVTLKGCSSLWERSPSLRFTVFAVLMFAVYGVFAAISSTFVTGRNLQFSHFLVGLDFLAIYGFFSMALFGAIYFIVPRITGAEWPSGSKIRTHFWFSTYGILTLLIAMLVGGVAQAESLAQWDSTFSVSFGKSKSYVMARIFAWGFVSFANFHFVYQLALMFFGKGRKSEGPTLIDTHQDHVDDVHAPAASH